MKLIIICPLSQALWMFILLCLEEEHPWQNHCTLKMCPDEVGSCALCVMEGVYRCVHSVRIVVKVLKTALIALSRDSPQLSM